MTTSRPFYNLASSKNVILFGYKASGKTHFGRLLAKELNKTFIDTDEQIEQAYADQHHKALNCREISIEQGEHAFRRLEATVIHSLGQVTDSVIAVGGGAVLDRENCQTLQKLGILIYLDVDKKILKERIFRDGIPSFLDPHHPQESFETMVCERQSIYDAIPSIRLKTQGKTELQILTDLSFICGLFRR